MAQGPASLLSLLLEQLLVNDGGQRSRSQWRQVLACWRRRSVAAIMAGAAHEVIREWEATKGAPDYIR